MVGKVAMSALVMVMGARRQRHQKPASWARVVCGGVVGEWLLYMESCGSNGLS